MPGVTKDGKPASSYGYDIGGKTMPIKSGESIHTSNDKSPGEGRLGRLDRENVDRFIERKPSGDDTKTYAKTGYESTAFDKHGNVKGSSKSEPTNLQADGSWAPAEGRGGSNTGTVMKRGKYSSAISK